MFNFHRIIKWLVNLYYTKLILTISYFKLVLVQIIFRIVEQMKFQIEY